MPQSLVKILVHTVFSTKNRNDLIAPEVESDLFGYMTGIVQGNKSKLIAINGTPNHVHMLVSLSRTIGISELIGDVKRDSSKWAKDRGIINFQWQEGYGAFSIGQSQVESVIKYIARQKEHHKKQSFEDEMRGLCLKYKVEFEERYIWD